MIRLTLRSFADRRNLDLHILPKWKSRHYDELTRADLIELIEGLITGGKATLANRVHALCSKIGSFAVDAGLLNGNPFGRLSKRGAENVGRRILTDDEVRLLWRSIVLPPVSRRVGLSLRLALLTGVRAGEVAGMARSEITHLDDATQAAWIIPAERVKNGRDHYVPLCGLARETIRAAVELIGDDDEYILGPARCMEFKDGISRAWKWRDANEQRLKEWKAEFTWGRAPSLFFATVNGTCTVVRPSAHNCRDQPAARTSRYLLPRCGESPVAPTGTQHACNAVRQVLAELYGDKVPDQTQVPNKKLCSAVRAKLPPDLQDIHNDTILRGADRK